MIDLNISYKISSDSTIWDESTYSPKLVKLTRPLKHKGASYMFRCSECGKLYNTSDLFKCSRCGAIYI